MSIKKIKEQASHNFTVFDIVAVICPFYDHLFRLRQMGNNSFRFRGKHGVRSVREPYF